MKISKIRIKSKLRMGSGASKKNGGKVVVANSAGEGQSSGNSNQAEAAPVPAATGDDI